MKAPTSSLTPFVLIPLAVAWGCGRPGARPPTLEPGKLASTTATDARETARLVEETEASVVKALAAVDARLAARLRVVPSEAELGQAAMGAVVRGDESFALVKGATDLFSFDVRARRIGEVSARLEHAPPHASLEWELLVRLVAGERARVEEERRLPRSASELVRGIVTTWTTAASGAEAKERDAWLKRRLDEVRGSLATLPLRPVEISELEDSLDPLERLADPLGYPDFLASLTQLRVALGQLRQSAPIHAEGWDTLERSLLAHIGIAPEPKTLRALLAELSTSLRGEAETRLAALPESDARAVREAAEGLILGTATCLDHASAVEPLGSLIRSFTPPPERAPLCAALRALANGEGGKRGLAARVALADEVTMAVWAIEINGDDLDPDHVSRAHRLLASIPPEREARLLRLAATRPLLPLGVALGASLVATPGRGGSPDERARRAAKWLAFGDAPLDIIARELGF